MNWKDILDRTVSTAVQAFVGSATALTAVGGLGTLTEWRTAAVSAGVAGIVALSKAVGISVAKSPTGGTEVTVTPDSPVEDLAHEVAAKLKG